MTSSVIPPKAIQTILDKIERWPDQLQYESQANLGTFYIHNNELEKGLIHIKKAIEINPDAHFGREIYQQLLVEYVIECRNQENGDTLPLFKASMSVCPGFAGHMKILAQENISSSENKEYDKAAKGIMGMMRFGHYDSPILLEALGDIMLARFGSGRANMIAARAYLKAGMETDSEDVKTLYRKKAEQALHMQETITTQRVMTDLQDEIRQGHALFALIQADEQAWEKAGKNLDKEFEAKYYKQTLPVLKVHWSFIDTISHDMRLGILIGATIISLWSVYFYKRRKRIAQAAAKAT